MRPLSRVLSVFLALILVGISLLTVSADGNAHDDDYGARVTISRNDDKEPVHVGTILTFQVLVERGNRHNIPWDARLTSAGSLTVRLGTSDDDNLVVDTTRALFSKEIEYTVQPLDLGGGIRRAAPIKFRLTFIPVDDVGTDLPNHPSAVVESNDFPVIITKKSKSASGDGSSEVEIVFNVEEPDEIDEGEKVTFTVSAVTGKYALVTKPIIIRKQLYNANGKKIGSAVHARTVIIRYLNTNSVSGEEEATYTLTEKDVEAATIEFFYELTIEDTDLRDADARSTDLDEDYEEDFEGSYFIGAALRSATPTPTTTRPTATPTPRPTIVGRSSAVTITRTASNRIFFDLRARGQDFSMTIGFLAPDGTRGFQRNGYVRDVSLGQTYAVVLRESDNKVVRVWIAPDSPERFAVPWDEVLEFYTFSPNIVDTIPLDETHPAEKQIVKVGIDWYVYLAGAWRHIPDIPTFQARGYFWCDVTSADIGFLRRVLTGRALQPSGTDEVAGYPSCRE